MRGMLIQEWCRYKTRRRPYQCLCFWSGSKEVTLLCVSERNDSQIPSQAQKKWVNIWKQSLFYSRFAPAPFFFARINWVWWLKGAAGSHMPGRPRHQSIRHVKLKRHELNHESIITHMAVKVSAEIWRGLFYEIHSLDIIHPPSALRFEHLRDSELTIYDGGIWWVNFNPDAS